MDIWEEPPRDLSNDSLRLRSEFGYALAAGNVFLEAYYRLPGMHNQILQAVEYSGQNVVTDELMAENVISHFNLVAPFQAGLPDSAYIPYFNVDAAESFISGPGKNLETFRTRFGIPIDPIMQPPLKQRVNWHFNWKPAYDVTGTSAGISYRMQVARTPTFDTNTVAVDISGIPDCAGTVTHTVDAAMLPYGEYYARLIATPANEPERFFQVSGNKLYADGNSY